VRFLLTCALAVLAACPGFPPAGPPPGPLQAPAVEAARRQFPTATAETLEAGRQAFLQHCNKCHKFPALGAYEDTQWRSIVPRMAGKSGLDTASGERVLQFVLAARGSSISSKP
jgi:cytochrome c5